MTAKDIYDSLDRVYIYGCTYMGGVHTTKMRLYTAAYMGLTNMYHIQN